MVPVHAGQGTPGEDHGDHPCRAQQPIVRRWVFFLTTAIVSATVLLLEITLTRVFSLFLHYHYVFIVVAVALLGLGVGATLWATMGPRWVRHARQQPARVLWQVCLGTGASLIVMAVLFTQSAFASVLPAAAGLALLPFVGAGVVRALVFTVAAPQSRELYAADLLGAGAGGLLSLPLLHWLGAEHTLVLAALGLQLLAALVAITADHHAWPVPVCTCLVLAGLLGCTLASGTLAIRLMAVLPGGKHLRQLLRTDPSARVVDSHWSALARTDVIAFSRQGQRQYAAFLDGGAATSLVALPTTPSEWAQLDHEVGLFPYRTSPRERVLIIGAGGGFDVLLALRGGAQAITAVEVNADILQAVERFIPPARNVYHLPAVTLVRGDGRQMVRRTAQAYDLIVLPQVYTGAAQPQGGALVENYVLTAEAFEDYLAHLTPEGRLVVQVHDAAEALKTALMGVEAFARRGVTGPQALHHLLILQEAPDTQDAPIPINAPLVILRNTPYTAAESHQQATIARAMQVMPLFMPHDATASPLAAPLRRVTELSTEPWALGATLRPATDDRPFFYETHADQAPLVWVVLAVLLGVLGLHVWHYARQRTVHAPATPSTAWLPFFAATGCAALLVQSALLQRYMLVLGSPTLTLVVLLVPLLCCGGVGSLASAALSDQTLSRVVPWSCIALGVLLGLYLAAFPALRTLLGHQPLLARVLGTMLLFAPLGVLMGLPFPMALRLLSPRSATLSPWIWGVNMVAGVLGSVAAVSLAVARGFQSVVIVGALIYVLAGCWAHRLLAQHASRV
jgi:spermidine synthase